MYRKTTTAAQKLKFYPKKTSGFKPLVNILQSIFKHDLIHRLEPVQTENASISLYNNALSEILLKISDRR
jgi:hypothetical protein